MDTFHMEDIIPRLPLPPVPHGKKSYYVPCPHCDRSGKQKEKHLNINVSKDVFRCARCGWYGGIFDLYAFYTGTPRELVRDELIRVFGTGDFEPRGKASGKLDYAERVTPNKAVETPVADIETRHAAYNSLLAMLTLAQDHQQNLVDRGLSEHAIKENGYRTTPVVGGRMIAKRLLQTNHRIEGVPGFYKDINDVWTFLEVSRGIMIPVRDSRGRIQGLQVRRDNLRKRKYRWVSSLDIEGSTCGCGTEGWTHLAGPVRERILLIEGPLKADVVHLLTGQTALAVPGVNSLKQLERALFELTELGVKQVMTAFDMDFLKNPHVQNGYHELVRLLGRMDLRFGTFLWHPSYNGLDDYIWEFCLERVSHSVP